MVLGGLVMLVFGARFLVDAAIEIAKAFGLSEAVIGLTIVAVGTSLPEFATSLLAAIKKESDIAVGNIVGSNIFNILGILGVSAMITPLSSSGITGVDLAVMAAFALGLWVFSATGHRISRTEGLLMLVPYAGYVIWLVARA
jgi:cation:H+ antiporter